MHFSKMALKAWNIFLAQFDFKHMLNYSKIIKIHVSVKVIKVRISSAVVQHLKWFVRSLQISKYIRSFLMEITSGMSS